MLKSLLILCATFLLAGCGISGDDSYELRSENIVLKTKIDSLITALNDLKYGAENTLKEANQKIKEKKFIDSKVLLTTVIRKYPTSKEYTTAQQLLKSVTPKVEDESFKIASNNTALLNAYLPEYPRGRYTARPKRLIKMSQRNDQPVVRQITYQKKKVNVSTVRTGARCCDGTLSSATGRGACSHHGGVCEWLY
jgi:hypothetical protein